MRFAKQTAPQTLMARVSPVKWPRTFFIRNVIVLLSTLLPLVLASAQEAPEELATFLRDRMGFTGKEFAELRRGEVVVTGLPSEQQEVAVFGIVLVNASADFFVERFRDIESYKKGASVPLVKKFSDPPRIEDLNQLKVDKKDFDAMKHCKVGGCDVKLPAKTIERLRREIDWNASDAAAQVNELARASLLEYVKRYLAGGNMALGRYDDKKNLCASPNSLTRF
jgi:hypothetical protein